MRVETKEYENDFEDFGTFIDNQGKKIKKALKGIGESFGVGAPGGGAAQSPILTPKGKQNGMMAGAMIPAVLPDDLIKQI